MTENDKNFLRELADVMEISSVKKDGGDIDKDEGDEFGITDIIDRDPEGWLFWGNEDRRYN